MNDKILAVDIEEEDMELFAAVLLKARAFIEGELKYSAVCEAAQDELENELAFVDFLLTNIGEVFFDESPA